MIRTIHPGDDGTTNFLGEGRISKDDLRINTLGSVDEADACFGIIRALCKDEQVKDVIVNVMKRLHTAMAEISAGKEKRSKLPHLSNADVEWVEEKIRDFQKHMKLPDGFLLAGDTELSAWINQARTATRRAERKIVRLVKNGLIQPGALIKFFNRLGTLCFYMQAWEIQAEGKQATLAND
jgi:cob(I)alamin adenosyltransferase